MCYACSFSRNAAHKSRWMNPQIPICRSLILMKTGSHECSTEKCYLHQLDFGVPNAIVNQSETKAVICKFCQSEV